MARRRRFSEEPFGPTIERLMAETGSTYRALAAKTELSAGYLNHLVHGNRPVPSNEVVETLARALTSSRITSASPAAEDHHAARVDAGTGRPTLPTPGTLNREAARRR
jgi:transcriptional regulator with XRE-family HTH domain